jgi:hypothetical protein
MNDSTSNRRNHLIWIGPLISVVGFVSYFGFFARFPALRDFPWLTLPLVLAGVVVSTLAIQRGRSWRSIAGAVFSASCAGFLFVYVFFLSNQLPPPDNVIALGAEAPAFSLPDQDGSLVRLADFRGRPVVLVFYRGFW